MKKLMIGLAVLMLMGLACVTAMAGTDDDVVTVTVDYVDLLDVPATAALTLTQDTPGATAYDQGTLTQTDGLLYSHNSTSAKKITATAVKDVGNPVNDVTLTVSVESGAGAKTLVSAGTDGAGQIVYTAIAAGGLTKDISWTADGSLATTKAGANVDASLIWTVTFTSADAA